MPRQSIFNTPPAEYDVPQQLDRWRKGMPPSARHLNQAVNAINRMRRFRGPNQAPSGSGGGGGGGGGATALEVKIAKALAVEADAADQEETDRFEELGPHLRCVTVAADGSVDPEQYLVVYPMFPRVVEDFKQGASQVFNAADPDDPHFFALGGSRGLTLRIGEAKDWTTAPLPSEVC